MTWKELLEQGRVERRPTTKLELEELRAVAQRSLGDARLDGISVDGKFGHAYETARALATVVVRAAGCRVRAHGGGTTTPSWLWKQPTPGFSRDTRPISMNTVRSVTP